MGQNRYNQFQVHFSYYPRYMFVYSHHVFEFYQYTYLVRLYRYLFIHSYYTI